MHARFYSNLTGRFWGVDPTARSVELSSPQSWNRYNYVQGSPLGITDPTGETLYLLGSKANLDRLRTLVDASLTGFDLKITKGGKATLEKNDEVGPASPEQRAFAEALAFAISRKENIAVGVVSGASSVMLGNYRTQQVDIGDISILGSGPGINSAGALAHEIVEQTIKQVSGLTDPLAADRLGHRIGLIAQTSVTGYQRLSMDDSGMNYMNKTGTLVSRLARGREIMTVTFSWVNGNLVKVARE